MLLRGEDDEEEEEEKETEICVDGTKIVGV